MSARLRITQTRSGIGGSPSQRRTLRALGLKHPNHTVEHPDRPEIRGMLAGVSHLLDWETLETGGGDDTGRDDETDETDETTTRE